MTYKPLTIDKVNQMMAEIFSQQMDPARTVKVMTGAAGMTMFDKAIKREATRLFCNSDIEGMERGKKISKEQATTLRKMLETDDDGDFDLAEEIVKNLKNVHL